MLDHAPRVTTEPRDHAVKVSASIAEATPGKEPGSSRRYEVTVSKEYAATAEWTVIIKEVCGKAARALLEIKLAHRAETGSLRPPQPQPPATHG